MGTNMKIMSDYIIHLVEDIERVEEILKEGYVPNFHKEDLSLSSEPADKFVFGIPMTSFADVDLENIKPLMGEYGNYGIVMSKQWALNSNNISPVHYISDERYLKEIIYMIKDDKLTPDFIRYTKKYISEWKGKEYCNYIERTGDMHYPILLLNGSKVKRITVSGVQQLTSDRDLPKRLKIKF